MSFNIRFGEVRYFSQRPEQYRKDGDSRYIFWGIVIGTTFIGVIHRVKIKDLEREL